MAITNDTERIRHIATYSSYWVVVFPMNKYGANYICHWSIAQKKLDAIVNFLKGDERTWKFYYQQGYRAIKVSLKVERI